MNTKTIRLSTLTVVISLLFVFGGLIIVFETNRASTPEIRSTYPEYRDVSASISTNGRVIPIQAFAARSALAGMVEKIYVQVGEKVKAGQPVIKLKDPFAESRYTNAVAGLQEALAANENYRSGGTQEDRIILAGDLNRDAAEQTDAADRLALLKELAGKGDASAAEVNDATRRLQAANSAFETARERITGRFSKGDLASSTARLMDARATVATAKQVLANANMTSTIAGTVYSIPVSTYDFVPMGADLVLIANLDTVQIRAFFDEPDIGQLHAGQSVDVFWNGMPNRSWLGRVEQPPLTVSTLDTRTVGQCIITVANSKTELLPNIDVTVRVTTDRHTHVMSIPREALHTEGQTHFVYRIIDGRLVYTPVATGIINLTLVEVISGLTVRDSVALEASDGSTLRDGLQVHSVR